MALGKPSVVRGKSAGKSGSHISLRPSDAESGGLLDDVNATIEVCEAVTWDYNGQADPGPALHLHLKADDGGEADQYYSAGKMDRIVPSDDGEQFDPAEGSSAKGLNNNCNAFVFLSQLVEKGFPEEKLESLSSVQGTYAHFNRVPQKRRAGLESDDGKTRTILVVTKILKLPWEKKGAKASSTGASASASSNGDGINQEAIEAVVSVLADNDGTMARKKLGMAVFKTLHDSNNRSKIMKLVTTDEFLEQEDIPFALDGDNVVAVE